MAIVNLNQRLKRVEIGNFELENEIVFNYFDRVPFAQRDELLFRAVYIGVLALLEDRISSFLAKTTNELGTQLESLKMIFEMKKELFFKSAVKGAIAEEEIAAFLNNYFAEKGLKDKAILKGNEAGELPRNKTGDIVCEVGGDPSMRIALEVKFDRSLKLGDIDSRDVLTKKMDTAWSQLLEAQVNRNSKVSMIVFDSAVVDSTILKAFEGVGFIPGIGFVVVVDSQRGDYRNLAIGYMLARDIILNAKVIEMDDKALSIIVRRIIRDINEILNIRRLVENNIENNKEILKQLEKSILAMQFNQEYLIKFLQDGRLDKKDMLAFYNAESVRDRYFPIEKEIDKMIGDK